MKNKKLFTLLSLSFLSFGLVTGVALSNDEHVAPVVAYENHDADTYYVGISGSATGNDLLSSLRTLNLGKRRKLVGYNGMGTKPSGDFKYTDYDPNYVQYDANQQPYGTRISSFYTYTSATSWNREHVWPDSHGGGKVEADIHMTRPTISSENSSRGNSFFVEGKNHSSNGWDPKTAGYSEQSRGEAARIVFYCLTASSQLCLSPTDTAPSGGKDPITGLTYGTGNTMGNLETLIKWNLNYPVTQREKNRNEGAEYLQGNRNAFVDHPEYVCRIWGNVNDTTRALCANDPYAASAPTSITLSSSSVRIVKGRTQSVSVASVVPSDASKSVRWTSSNASIASVSSEGVITANEIGTATITATSIYASNVTASCTVSVVAPSPVALTGLSVSVSKETIKQGGASQISATFTPSDVYPIPTLSYSSDVDNVVTISNSGLVTGLNPGSAIITVTATQNNIVIPKQVVVNVEETKSADGSITVSKDSVDGSGSYNWYNWTQGDISGEAYIYASNTESLLQFNSKQSAKCLANTTELPGDLVSITAKSEKGDKKWKLYASDKAIVRGSVSGATDLGEQTVTSSGTTWEISSGEYRYFSLVYTDSGAAYLKSVEISYGGSGGGETEVHLSSIKIDHAPNKVSYNVGETLVLDGLKVNAYYSDDRVVDVTSQVTTNITGVLNEVGTFPVIVSFTDNNAKRSATFTITVVDPSSGGDTPTPPPTPTPRGCTGNVATTSIILSSLAIIGISLILIKKHKKEGN